MHSKLFFLFRRQVSKKYFLGKFAFLIYLPVPDTIVKGKEIVEDFKENKFHIVFTESIFPNQTLLIKQTLARIKIA